MKTLSLLFFTLIFSHSSFAFDVASPNLVNEMAKKAKKRAYDICGGAKKTFFPKGGYQVHDTYLKYEGDADEGGTQYFYAPKVTGVASCKKSDILIQWTANSTIDASGEPVYDGLITTVVRTGK